jgi:phage gp36-like protein
VGHYIPYTGGTGDYSEITPYINEQRLMTILKDLIEVPPNQDPLDDAINAAIDAGEAEVDSSLRLHNTLPLSEPYPADVVGMSATLFRYNLYLRHSKVSDDLEKEVEAVRKLLALYAENKKKLPGSGATTQAALAQAVGVDEPHMTREKLAGL